MRTNSKFFKGSKFLPIDKFFQNVLYDETFGYYNSKFPFGKEGDFTTSPKISNLFSEIIAIWIISTWEKIGKPKNINIVELGPGDGSLTKVLLDVFKKFKIFDNSKKLYLYEISPMLRGIQKRNIGNKKVRWIKNLNYIKKGPIIFFGNEFFDSFPIKQFKVKRNILEEKYYVLEKNFRISEVFKKTSKKDSNEIKKFKTLKKLKFIEFPKLGFKELTKIIKKISKLGGCLLMIDYGYINSKNQDTLQSVLNHKRNKLLNNLGKADITSHVNFSLLKEYFIKNKMKVKKVITQREFLKKMGILKRAEIISKNMKFSDQSNLYFRLKRLISPKSMGDLFKVIFTYNFKHNNFHGFK